MTNRSSMPLNEKTVQVQGSEERFFEDQGKKNPTVATCANTAGSGTSKRANGIQAEAQKFKRAALTLSSHVQISALTKTLSYRLGSIFARKRLFGLTRRLLDAQLMIFFQNRSARM